MPPRRKARRKRRSPKNFKLLTAAESYAQAALVTNTYLGSTPVEFLFGDAGFGFNTGRGEYSISEIARNPALLGTIGERFMDPQRAAKVIVGGALINIGFRFGKRALRRSINAINRPMRQLGIGVVM
tara:strand:+ start:3701 stop:4081 length:381 start_codon:yes stop_codon:yes gene_type:complete